MVNKDVYINWCARTHVGLSCGKFGDCSFSRFGLTCGQTDTQTPLNALLPWLSSASVQTVEQSYSYLAGLVVGCGSCATVVTRFTRLWQRTRLRGVGEELHETAIHFDRLLRKTIFNGNLELEFCKHVTVEHHAQFLHTTYAGVYTAARGVCDFNHARYKARNSRYQAQLHKRTCRLCKTSRKQLDTHLLRISR